MKRILIFLTFIFSELNLCGQIQFEWAISNSMGPGAIGKSVSVDMEGNVIVSGKYYSSHLYGSQGMFLNKYDSKGKLIWSNTIQTQRDCDMYNTVDEMGNIYVTGDFRGWSIWKGDTIWKDKGDNGFFYIAKFNKKGELIWLHPAGDEKGGGHGYKIKHYNGKLFVLFTAFCNISNYFFKGCYIASINLVNGSFENIILINNSFNFLAGDFEIYNANIYVIGNFYGKVLIDGKAFNSFPDESSTNLLLIKIDTTGKLIWADHENKNHNRASMGGKIELDEHQNIYRGGGYTSGAVIGGTERLLPTDRVIGMYLLKYDRNGNLLWQRDANCRTCTYGRIGAGVFKVNNGNIFTTSCFDTVSYFDDNKTVISPIGYKDQYVARYDLDGKLKEVIQTKGTGDIQPWDISANIKGELFITGSAMGSINFETKNIYCDGMYLVKISGAPPVSVKEITSQKSTNFNIFPNPGSCCFTIQCEQKMQAIHVRNILGTEVFYKKLHTPETCLQLDLSAQPKGVYFVEVENAGTRSTEKIVLQ